VRNKKDQIELSASDLGGFLNCRHLTELDKKVLNGELDKPDWNNPHTATLQERGLLHEASYLEFLESQGLSIVSIPEDMSYTEGMNLTVKAMEGGADIIAQGVLRSNQWFGKLDILRKVEGSSKLGSYSYEVMDTKLSRETKATSILQLCLYSEFLSEIIETEPVNMYVVTPGEPFNEERYRINDYKAYYSLIKDKLVSALEIENETYPDPVSHCDVCKWFDHCNQKRRDDDHLSFVAGLTSSQAKDLKSVDIDTLRDFATCSDDVLLGIDTNTDSLKRLKEQARMQLEARESGSPSFEIIDLQEERGLNRLPYPCDGDIFFDLEGDQYYRESGIEYLWGYSYLEDGELKYKASWALNYREEKKSFEDFIDYIVTQKTLYPHLKIYHYSAYEPGALKRLMGRYGTREREIDHLLRTQTFVDLYSIVRQSVRAGIEKYSIKDLEQFYQYERKAVLQELIPAKRQLEHALELGREDFVSSEVRDLVELYNRDDTDSTYYLREWLEGLRSIKEEEGEVLSRPLEVDGEIDEELNEHLQRLIDLRDALQDGVSEVPEERSPMKSSQWLLGDLVAFYRREDKVNFWEKFRLKDLDALELLEDKSGLSGLKLIDTVGGTAKCPIHRYSFIEQIADIKKGSQCFKEGLLNDEKIENFGSIEFIDYENRFIDIKKKAKFAELHPNALWIWNHINKKNKADRLMEYAEYILENGFETDSYKAATDILLGKDPRLKSSCPESYSPLERAKQMALSLDESFLAIQGPPGTGKSYTASRVILALIEQGHKVGVTGLSHKVICGLLDKVVEASGKENIPVTIFQKTNKEDETNEAISYINNKSLGDVLERDEPYVLGGTDFMWASENCRDVVDYLVIDEAGQFSLVGVLSIAHVAKNFILLGDGAQLQQPIQGSHPEGCEVSALDYIVGDHETLPSEKGVFLPTTYRLHPDICKFNSDLFYEGRLKAIPENICQVVTGETDFQNQSLSYVEVEHFGNTSSSIEELKRVKEIVTDLVSGKNFYTVFKDGKEVTSPVTYDSIKIISPYNAQVNLIRSEIPEVSVGTVDKFQGQEAPIVIYSMATSSPEDAPRGMDFLYSRNRLNVAVSRAECLFIMVANKKVFEPNCKTPYQMKLANTFCQYLSSAFTSTANGFS
tara:strand:+ start:1981 stop:5400 length:3420 start_codon:yes stop_codon:yes gene_type:complete